MFPLTKTNMPRCKSNYRPTGSTSKVGSGTWNEAEKSIQTTGKKGEISFIPPLKRNLRNMLSVKQQCHKLPLLQKI